MNIYIQKKHGQSGLNSYCGKSAILQAQFEFLSNEELRDPTCSLNLFIENQVKVRT